MEAFITYAGEYRLPDFKQGEPEHMPVDAFLRYIQVLQRSNFKVCRLCGNEAVLHPELPRLVEISQEHSINPAVETSGVITNAAWDNLEKLRCEFFAKVYHPLLYPKKYSLDRTIDNFKRFRQRRNSPIGMRVFIDDPARDYSFLADVVKRLDPASIELELPPLSDDSQVRSFTQWFADEMFEDLKPGTSVVFNCFLLCAFSNEVMGKLIKNNVLVSKCHPKLGIRPDSGVYHCRGLLPHATADLIHFSSIREIDNRIKQKWGPLQFTPNALQGCAECKSYLTGACWGHCLAGKRHFVLKELEKLEEKSEGGLSAGNLLKAGCLYAVMEDYRSSENYLIAARGADPANGKTHLLLARVLCRNQKLKQAEEEYKKAIRLCPSDSSRIEAEMSEMITGQKNQDSREKR